MSTAQLGAARERRCRDWMLMYGWEFVCRSAGSKGPADLVMVHAAHGLALVQVGTSLKRIDPGPRERLLHVSELAGALPLIATEGTPQGNFRLRIVSPTPAQSWTEFDPLVGFVELP